MIKDKSCSKLFLRTTSEKREGLTWGESRAGEQDNFFLAPAPEFFSKRLRLLIIFPAALAPGIFFSSGSGSKGPKNMRLLAAPALDYWFGKNMFFPPNYSYLCKTVCKKYKTMKNFLFYLKKCKKCFLSSRSLYRSRIFFALPSPAFSGAAPAPVFFSSGSGSKGPKTPSSGSSAALGGKS